MNLVEQLLPLKPESMESIHEEFGVLPKDSPWAEHYTWYYALSSFFRPATIFEIGVLGGFSLASLLLGNENAKAEGWDIEQYKPHSNDEASDRLARMGLSGRVRILNRDSQKAPSFGRWSMVDVDGDHCYAGAMSDLEKAASASKIVLFDDMYNTNTDCKQVGEEFLAQNADAIEYHEIVPTLTGLLVIKFK